MKYGNMRHARRRENVAKELVSGRSEEESQEKRTGERDLKGNVGVGRQRWRWKH